MQVIVFPELNLTGYSCGDLFGQTLLLEQAELGLMRVMNNTRQLDIISIVGMPVRVESVLMNCAVVIQKGKILGIVPKTYLPNYKEFYEHRWFASAFTYTDEVVVRLCGQLAPVSANLLFETSEVRFGIELCEDVWAPVPPSSALAPIRKTSANINICVRSWHSSRLGVWLAMSLLLRVSENRPPM